MNQKAIDAMKVIAENNGKDNVCKFKMKRKEISLKFK